MGTAVAPPEELRKAVLATAPRVLGLIDRRKSSNTFGCSDRTYWHYKLLDLPNARFQEACLLLTLLYSTEFPGNPYAGKESVWNWILGMIRFWCRRQNRDGSFAEVYPYERSFCATSFSSLAVSESVRILAAASGDERSEELLASGEILNALLKAGRWIASNICFDACNQVGAAISALARIARLSNEPLLADRAAGTAESLFERHRSHGFFPEYGGFDLGYTTITTSCLAYYAETLKDPSPILERIASVNAALAQRIDPMGNYDFSRMSRQTSFLYPFGFAATGSPVLECIQRGLFHNKILSPAWMDDRYCVPLVVDYAKTVVSLENKNRLWGSP